MANRWTWCWKCNQDIMTQVDCNYLKIRDGDFSFCPSCYKDFLEHNTEFILPDKIQQQELQYALFRALVDYHDKMVVKNEKGRKSLVKTLHHSGDSLYDCPFCQKIITYFVLKKEFKH